MASAWGFHRQAVRRFLSGFEEGLGFGAATLPGYYMSLYRATGLRTVGKSLWSDLVSTPMAAGLWTGTAATAAALTMGLPMALGGAYDLITGRRRSRLAGFTQMAAGVAIAGLPFYGPSLYRWARPQAIRFWNKLLR